MDILHNAPLKSHNTFGIDVRAKALARFNSVEQLRELLAHPGLQELPRLVLGGGSNVLFTRDWPGVVLLNEVEGISATPDGPDHMIVSAGAGTVWHAFVTHCVANGWGGVENLSLIPGRVGAAPMQNIGAYGVEIKDTFHHLEALRISDGEVVRFSKDECRFGYRESYFKREGKDKYVILRVAFRLSTAPLVNVSYGSIKQELQKRGIERPTIAQVSEAVIAIRSSKLPDPLALGNAGSFFKNPVVPATMAEAIKANIPDLVVYPGAEGEVKLAAGQLIEKAGWKGFKQAHTDGRTGGFGVHTDQALVLVNHGRSTGAEVYDLSTRILESVKDLTGVDLEREVNIL
ncbi:MAG TPA: UDP-N-acetylmuramate dehydrogenase [Flavobacteriales bacterium]